jgi:hypothetical protein
VALISCPWVGIWYGISIHHHSSPCKNRNRIANESSQGWRFRLGSDPPTSPSNHLPFLRYCTRSMPRNRVVPPGSEHRAPGTASYGHASGGYHDAAEEHSDPRHNGLTTSRFELFLRPNFSWQQQEEARCPGEPHVHPSMSHTEDGKSQIPVRSHVDLWIILVASASISSQGPGSERRALFPVIPLSRRNHGRPREVQI